VVAVGGCSRDLSEVAGTERHLGGGVACRDAAERGGGMQRVPLPGGGAEPPERVQGIRQAPQQDVVQVPRAQRLPRRR